MKEIMDGYRGVKFKAIQLSAEMPFMVKDPFLFFKKSADMLKEHGMTPENGGNMSIKFRGGMAITSSGANLGYLEGDEIVYAKKCSPEDRIVEYKGVHVPSSETFMHHLMYILIQR